jgi:hypothetical protein
MTKKSGTGKASDNRLKAAALAPTRALAFAEAQSNT